MSKSFFQIGCVAIAILTTTLTSLRAQADSGAEKTIRDFFRAMSARDAAGLTSVLDGRLALIGAGRAKASIGFQDLNDAKELFPRPGDPNWKEGSIELSAINVEVSQTHPSVGMASFTLTVHFDKDRIAKLKAALDANPSEFNSRTEVEKWISDRGISASMFAMLARKNGEWKIVCLSLPS